MDHGYSTDPNDISGIFGRLLFTSPNKPAYVTDGLSNTIMVGEMLGLSHDHSGNGSWGYNGSGNAHLSTVTTMYDMTTCYQPGVVNPSGQTAAQADPLASNPPCYDWANWN